MNGMARTITEQVIEDLYHEAMMLADEARVVFDQREISEDAEAQASDVRIALSVEGLRTTTRIMHDLAWLLNHRAFLSGEMSARQLDHAGKLETARASDPRNMSVLPFGVRAFIRETERFHERVARIDASRRAAHVANDGPVGDLQGRIADAFRAR